MFQFLTFIPFLIIPLVKGECPDIEDIPIMRHPDDGLEGSIGEAGKVTEPTFTCATVWQTEESTETMENDILSCNGASFTLADNANFSGSDITVGSAFVMPSCSLYLFKNSNHENYMREVEGQEKGLDLTIKSLKCRCKQKPVSCTPEDHYEVLVDCDNTHGDLNMTCHEYSYSIGTEFGEEISGFDVSDGDQIVRDELESQLWGLFSNNSVWTSSTTYDWSQISVEAMSEKTDVMVRAEPAKFVPPGSWLKVEQVIGKCGGTVVKTEMLRSSYDVAEAKNEQSGHLSVMSFVLSAVFIISIY